MASVDQTDARKFLGDPTRDEVSSGTGQAPVSRARSATAGSGVPIGPESDVLGRIVGLDPARNRGHGDGVVASLCDSTSAESCVR